MPGCCHDGEESREQDAPIRPVTVTLDHLSLPHSATREGGNVSPAITITGMDPTARSIAIMVFNPFIKTCCSFTPWIIWNLPPVSRIPEGFPPGGAVFHPLPAIQGMNDYGETGYHGPEPAGGELQRYQFRVYILTAALDLREGATKNQLIAAMRGHVIQYGETVAIARG